MSASLAILLPTDDSASAREAARHVVHLASLGLAVDVHLLSVQTPVRGSAAALVGAAQLNEWHREEGMKALAGCDAILAAAGIKAHLHVGLGDAAETVIAFAARLGCAQIVMGSRGHGLAVGLVLGSVANGVIAGCTLPVTLIRVA